MACLQLCDKQCFPLNHKHLGFLISVTPGSYWMSESPQLTALGNEEEEAARLKPEMLRRKQGAGLEGLPVRHLPTLIKL